MIYDSVQDKAQMQRCPLCNNEYSDIAKICPKLHCDNCGSLRLKKIFIRNFVNVGSKTDYEFFRFFSLFFIAIAIFYIYSKHGIVFELVYPLIAIGIFQPLLYFFKTKSANLYSCMECSKKGFKPISDVTLGTKGGTTEERRKLIEEKVQKDTSEGKILEEISKGTRYSKKQLWTLIIGTILTIVVITVLGIMPYFENVPDLVIADFGNVDNPYAKDTVTYQIVIYNQGKKAAEGCVILLDDGIKNSSKIPSNPFVVLPNDKTSVQIKSHVYPSIGNYLIQAYLQCTNYPKLQHEQFNLNFTMIRM